TEEFVLNVPSTSMLEKVNLTGIKFPADIDEFEKAKFTPIPASQVKPSLIAECRSHFECKLLNIHEITKTRVIITGEVVAISIDRELFLKDFAKQKGQLDPLFYVQGAYFGLGRYVGKR
ncbi:MAG: flavin reductase family protein, partial [Candidatus Atribacteria bacterium]|nr:flavin reductase family protein [Candidatus Atribacteria bacterium]